jgi:hypothetical protein
MKNCPGTPDSRLPRLRRTRLYGPIRSCPRDRLDRCERTGKRCDARHSSEDRGFANEVAVRARAASVGRVHDEIAPAPANKVDDRGAAPLLRNLPNVGDGQARSCKGAGRPRGGAQLEAERRQTLADYGSGVLVRVAHGKEGGAALGERPPGRPLGLGEGSGKVGRAGHDLSGGAHLGTEDRIRAREAREGKDRRLHGDVLSTPSGQVEI